MKKILLTIIITLNVFACHAQITRVTDMKEIFEAFNEADSKTLAIFDVDMVLVQPSDPAFQMANMMRYSTIAKRIMKEVPADKQMVFLSLMTINSHPILIDANVPQILEQITARGIPAMALTANLTGHLGSIEKMEHWRVESLKKLGIDFSLSAPCKLPIVFDNLSSYRGNYSTYLDGVLFVNGSTVSKGDAFLSFLEKSGFSPSKVIFVDDREDNLKSLEAAIQRLNCSIEYHGFHYLGAQKYPSEIISEEEFESRWQKLLLQINGFSE